VPGTLADTGAIAWLLDVKPDNIRHWAHRHPGELPKRGRKAGRTLYAIEDAKRLAARLHPPACEPGQRCDIIENPPSTTAP